MCRSWTVAALLIACSFVVPYRAGAEPILLGVVSFDTLIPGPGGTNAFFVSNLTGDPNAGGFALPPDFPVITDIVFNSASLSWLGPAGSPYDFGGVGIGPGSLDPAPQLQFSDTTAFLSALFSATLSTDLFELADGRSFRANALTIFATLTNLDGSIMPGDFAILSVDADELTTPTPVPEPASLTLLLTGLAVGIVRKRWRPSLRTAHRSSHE